MLADNKLSALARRLLQFWPWFLAVGCVVLFLLFWYWEPIVHALKESYTFLGDRDRIAEYVATFGNGAPVAFMAIQILQVIFAPIPGEATGFIGGYLFGAFAGCFYSTIALTIGSWINFSIGRMLGKRWVRKIIAPAKLEKFDHLLRHQGILVVFLLFLFPGFPKDYLCLFLGVSTIPMRVFLLMAFIGRIPGTLMLSLQGDLVFEKNYLIFCLVVAINLLIVYLGYRYRESIYRWIEKINGPPSATIDEDEQ